MRFIPAVSRVRIPLSLLQQKGIRTDSFFVAINSRKLRTHKTLRVPAVERSHEVRGTSALRRPERSGDRIPLSPLKKVIMRSMVTFFNPKKDMNAQDTADSSSSRWAHTVLRSDCVRWTASSADRAEGETESPSRFCKLTKPIREENCCGKLQLRARCEKLTGRHVKMCG